MNTTSHRFGGAPTRRACEAASVLGVLLDDDAACAPAPVDAGALLGLRAGEIALVVGPSGAGKSTLLRSVARAWRERGVRVIDVQRVTIKDLPAVDLLPGSVEEAMRRLARFGLAEARCFVRRASELSDGQRARLALAIACARAEGLGASATEGETRGDAALIVDEFGASLDDHAAAGAARALRRVASGAGSAPVVVASTRGVVERALAPDVIVRIALDGRVRVERRDGTAPAPPSIVVERGAMRDYGALARLHYRAGAPGRPALVLRARLRRGGDDALVGVLVAARPVLNGAWRAAAWPGDYDTGDARADARRLNRDIRTIARVVVDPRFRAMGVATRLVRAYLRAPLTRRTEALAAMGDCCPFFERAGMTGRRVPPSPRHARLLDALDRCGVEPWRLATPRTAFARAVDTCGVAFVERELRKWANDAGADRARRDDDVYELFRRACRVVARAPVVYVHDARG